MVPGTADRPLRQRPSSARGTFGRCPPVVRSPAGPGGAAARRMPRPAALGHRRARRSPGLITGRSPVPEVCRRGAGSPGDAGRSRPVGAGRPAIRRNHRYPDRQRPEHSHSARQPLPTAGPDDPAPSAAGPPARPDLHPMRRRQVPPRPRRRVPPPARPHSGPRASSTTGQEQRWRPHDPGTSADFVARVPILFSVDHLALGPPCRETCCPPDITPTSRSFESSVCQHLWQRHRLSPCTGADPSLLRWQDPHAGRDCKGELRTASSAVMQRCFAGHCRSRCR